MNEVNVKSVKSPLKLFIGDLQRIKLGADTGDFPCSISLHDHLGHTVVQFSQVWIQGQIQSVDAVANNLKLKDDTGQVQVSYGDKVPGADRSWIKPGVYCGLLACVYQSDTTTPLLSAVKLMDLPNKQYAKEMWPYEVRELALFLMNKIIPNLKKIN